MFESMNGQSEKVRIGYDQYANERDRHELEQRQLAWEKAEEIRRLMHVDQEEAEADDALWDEEWDRFTDEVYAEEQMERLQQEQDEQRDDH